MIDREKVIKTIDGCINDYSFCNKCDYDGCVFQHGSCEKDLLADALELLKELTEMKYKAPVQSLIDHIKTAIDVDPWAKEMVEELLKEQEEEIYKLQKELNYWQRKGRRSE